jgi:hypothetical protein
MAGLEIPETNVPLLDAEVQNLPSNGGKTQDLRPKMAKFYSYFGGKTPFSKFLDLLLDIDYIIKADMHEIVFLSLITTII